MSGVGIQADLRIGCVQYLNSKPLIYGLEGVVLAHPRELAERLHRNELDVALVPVVELLRTPAEYVVVDGVAIASNGPVYSVFLAHQGPLEAIQSVIADPASLTSVHLVQVLLEAKLGRKVPVVSESDQRSTDESFGRLWIGNQAIRFREGNEGTGVRYWDLGEAWQEWTGLPFVYAVWVMHRRTKNQREVAHFFREVARRGQNEIEAIVGAEPEGDRLLARRYLTENIRFGLGNAEKAGLERFREELGERGFLGAQEEAIDFV